MKNREDLVWVNTQVRFLEGDILTIIDASIGEKEQRKALKDVLRNAFKRRMDYIAEILTEEKGNSIDEHGNITFAPTFGRVDVEKGFYSANNIMTNIQSEIDFCEANLSEWGDDYSEKQKKVFIDGLKRVQELFKIAEEKD